MDNIKYNSNLNMSRSFKIVFTVVYTMCFLCFFAFSVRPSNTNGLLLLPCGFLFICIWSLVAVFTKWKAARFWAAAPLVACLLLLPIENIVGSFVRNELFQWRFPRYQALVQKIESGAMPIAAEGQTIPPTNYDSSLAYAVWARQETNGVLIVEFDYGHAGPPPCHVDYIYISSGVIEPGSYLDKRWPSKANLKNKWFEVAN